LIDKLRLTGAHANNAWRGHLNSPVINGAYVLPDVTHGETIELDLTSLKLPSISALEKRGEQMELNPRELPNLDLKSDAFFIGESNLGRLNLVLRQKKTGLIIQNFSLKSKRD